MSVQVPNGVVDLLVPDDAAAVAARRYLSYFSGPLHEAEHDDQRRLIPENRVRAYDVRPVIEALCDTGSVLELRAGFGTGILTALVRIGWHAAGLLANHPLHLGGAIDERTAVVRPFGAMFVAGARLTVPLCAVVLRKAYGLGAMAMTAGDLRRPAITVAWPTGEFGGMGLEGAVRLGYRRELDAIPEPGDRQAHYEQLVADQYTPGQGAEHRDGLRDRRRHRPRGNSRRYHGRPGARAPPQRRMTGRVRRLGWSGPCRIRLTATLTCSADSPVITPPVLELRS